MKKILFCCRFVERFMPLLILAVAGLALFFPHTGLWIDSAAVSPLLAVVMFGMGMNMSWKDVEPVLRQPKNILCGCAAQFLIMPALAMLLGKAFALDSALLTGLVLVGACPGGTASNVITFLARGDIALSVGMTTVNTLLAPPVTSFIVWLLLRTSVEVDALAMFRTIAMVVLAPIGLGLLLHRVAEKYPAIRQVMPSVSVLAIAAIIACIVSHQAPQLLATGGVILLVVVLHNLGGFACGYLTARLLRLNTAQAKALSIEVGMQNSGLATALAQSSFPSLAMATVPGVLFSVWHNISGSLLAALCRYSEQKKN